MCYFQFYAFSAIDQKMYSIGYSGTLCLNNNRHWKVKLAMISICEFSRFVTDLIFLNFSHYSWCCIRWLYLFHWTFISNSWGREVFILKICNFYVIRKNHLVKMRDLENWKLKISQNISYIYLLSKFIGCTNYYYI